MRWPLLWMLAACGLPDDRIQVPPGTVGEVYHASLATQSNTTWTAGALPRGLTLQPDGDLTGTPWEVGTFEIDAVVTRGKREQSHTVQLEIGAPEGMLACGGEITLSFTEGAQAWFEIDLERPGSRHAVDVLLPYSASTAEFTATLPVEIFSPRPGDVVNQENPRFPARVNAAQSWALTTDSSPSLEALRSVSPLVELIVSSQITEDVTLGLACTSTPVLESSTVAPVLLGEEFVRDYSHYGGSLDQVWSAVGLPDWIELGETGGIRGVAETLGMHPFELTVEDHDQTLTFSTGLGVFEQQPVACGDTLEVQNPEGYWEGEISHGHDPRGFWAGRLPLDPSLSAITLSVEGLDVGGGLGFGSTGSEGSTRHGAMSDNEDALSTTISARTEPTLSRVNRGEEAMHPVVYHRQALSEPALVTIECDHTPQVATHALPTLDTNDEAVLQSVGGVGEVTWTATDLPDGVTLSEDGVLTAVDAEAGRTDPSITLTDSTGESTTESLRLWVGEDGCGQLDRVACGETIRHTLQQAGSDWLVCIPHAADHTRVGVELYSLGARFLARWVTPGSKPADDLRRSATFVAVGDAASAYLDDLSSYPLEEWADQPLVLELTPYIAGEVGMVVTCSDVP